jgi:hypothetical protein
MLRGLLLLAGGIYLLVKSGANFGDIATHIAARLELDPRRPFIRHLVAKLELTEGIGMLRRKRWAEWLTVVATALLVPFEAYELVRHPSWLKAIGITVNVLIVVYLVRVVRRRAPSVI